MERYRRWYFWQRFVDTTDVKLTTTRMGMYRKTKLEKLILESSKLFGTSIVSRIYTGMRAS